MPYALFSVTDKSGICDLAAKLADHTLIASGGTAKHLTDSGYNCMQVSDFTDFPEVFGGRVKTLHPKIFGGILYNREKDTAEAVKHGIEDINLVCVNLYNFSDNQDSETNAIEHIDVGGPSLLRAAAKNFASCIVFCDPNDYHLYEPAKQDIEVRKKLAGKVFQHTSSYDQKIADYFETDSDKETPLRYGENPSQTAQIISKGGQLPFHILGGKQLSYNNYLDCDGALELASEFDLPTVAIIKHTNPCGVSSHESIATALTQSFHCDPLSAFGGIIATNGSIDAESADILKDKFIECIVAKAFSEEAMRILEPKKNLRLLTPNYEEPCLETDRTLASGAILRQSQLARVKREENWENKTSFTPDWEEAEFAMRCVKHIKSNAIVFTKGQKTLAIGAGQMSRIDALKFAVQKAKEFGHNLSGATLGSDAFFPFSDCVELAAQLGVHTIVQPGGSKRDQESIDMAEKHGVAMVMTHERLFKH